MATVTGKFKRGDFVRRVSKPDQAGLVSESQWDEQTESWFYRIQFGNVVRGIPEEDLEFVPQGRDPREELAQGSAAGARAFQDLLTFERLRKPPSRIAFSFGSAKAILYPYQFKPLLKFLENPRQRLLVADDVGLGKTIEAGYILRELDQRYGLRRVLIVVPARLQTKWRDELERRFDQTFQIVKARDFKQLHGRLSRGQESGAFRWIVSLESARSSGVVEFLSEYQIPLDLVVVDEAHRLRNPQSAQHKLGVALGNCADAMLFLTATPVQTSLDNLFWLLHLLEPARFADSGVFGKQVEANRPVVEALRLLRTNLADSSAVLIELQRLRENTLTFPLTEGRFFESLMVRCGNLPELERRELVELQQDISELSLTGDILTRTRKPDVVKDRPQRRARSVAVRLTEAERNFYETVSELCRLVRPDLHGWGLAMSVLTAYRYTASCIPASAELFRSRLWAGLSLDNLHGRGFIEDYDWTSESLSGQGKWQHPAALSLQSQLLKIVDAITPWNGVDTKFDQFLSALRAIWADDQSKKRSPRKVVVFAWFRRTLDYLSDRLEALGIAHELIHGDVNIPERESRIENFAADRRVKVLLSSEVGSEGIDLQFASVVVNYDLPWNPMVVEQRIGRLDRIGQEMPIVILNLYIKDTVEERILLRLFERIGLFKETVGELDPILGQTIDRLVSRALQGDLTPEEQERQADQTASAAVRDQQEAAQLADHAESLLSADQAFMDEIESLAGKRRIPDADELHRFVSDVFGKHYKGFRLPAELADGVGLIEAPPEVVSHLQQEFPASREALRVAGKLDLDRLPATFDSAISIRHPKADLIHSRHPLVLLAANRMQGASDTLLRVFALKVNAPAVPAGLYLLSLWFIEVIGARDRTDVIPFLVCADDESCLPPGDAERVLSELLERADDVDSVPLLSRNRLDRLCEIVDQKAAQHRGYLLERESNLNLARAERRKVTIDATMTARVRAAKERLSVLRSKNAAEFAIKMGEARLKKATSQRRSALEKLEVSEELRVEDERVAVALVQIN